MSNQNLSVGYLLQNSSLLFEINGARTHILQIVDGLQHAGHRVTVLAMQGRKAICMDRSKDLCSSGRLGFSGSQLFKIPESGIRHIQTKFNLPYLGLFDSYRFYDACSENGKHCHIFHERLGFMSIGGAQASRKLRIPFILEANADPIMEMGFKGISFSGTKRILAEWMLQFNYRAAARILTVSDVVKDDLVKRRGISPEKVIVLPNAADVDKFSINVDSHFVRHEFGLGNGPLVVFVGSFNLWHDLRLLIDSFACVVQEVPSATLVLIGNGPNREKVEEQAKASGLSQSTIFTGSINHEKIPELLIACDVAVAPYPKVTTGFWGSPIKIFEYMAASKAIVASRAGQLGQVIQHGVNGLLVEPGDQAGFAQAIVTLLRNQVLRKQLGENARRQAVERHSQESYIKQLEELYWGVL